METNTKLFLAIYEGRLDKVTKLINFGANVNAEFQVWHARRQLSDFLQQKELYKLDSPLHFAIRHNREDIYRFLVANGADINAKNYKGISPLHDAIFAKNFKIFLDLIRLRADCNSETSEGITPLMAASKNEDTRFMKELLKRKVDVELEDKYKRRAIHHSLSGKFENFKILFDAGANINTRLFEDKPLISEACSSKSRAVVAFLIKLGVDINQKCRLGKTPLNYSLVDSELTKMLIQKGSEMELGKLYWNPILYNRTNYFNIKSLPIILEAGANVDLVTVVGQPDSRPLIDISTLKLVAKYSVNIDMNIMMENTLPNFAYIDCRTVFKIFLMYFLLRHPRANKPENVDLPECIENWWNNYKIQVELMQSHILGKSDITLYRFLTETDQNKVVGFLSNKSTGLRQVLALNWPFYDKTFSFYAELIKERFSEGVKKAMLHAEFFASTKKQSFFIKANKHFMLRITRQMHNWNLE